MFEQIFESIRLRVELTESDKALLASVIQVRRLQKRELLLKEGEICRQEYYVNKGCLRAYVIDDKGVEHVLQFAVEDWWIGDMSSFINGTPARLYIDALEESEVFCFDKADWDQLLEKAPHFEKFFRKLLQRAFVSLQDRITMALSASAEERYTAFQERFPQIVQRVQQHQIASFLGMAPESLSRIRRKRLGK